jgi:hypothetical protein
MELVEKFDVLGVVHGDARRTNIEDYILEYCIPGKQRKNIRQLCMGKLGLELGEGVERRQPGRRRGSTQARERKKANR